MPRNKKSANKANTQNKNKNNNNNKRPRNKKRGYALPGGFPTQGVHITGCARDYISCLTNPFRNISPLPCIPDLISLPSNKFQVRVMANTITNDLGQAQVGLFPFNALVNDRVCLYTNTSALALGGTDFNFNTNVAEVIGNLSNSPYGTANFGNTYVQARLVGIGLKVRYAGTELNRGGQMVLYRSQSNVPLVSGTIAQLLTSPLARRVSMERKFHAITYVPDDPDYLGYQTFSSMSPGTNPGASLIIVITGAQSKQTFEVEVVGYFEMIGSTVGSSNTTFTKSHVDLPGLAAAIDSLPSKLSEKTPEVEEQSVMAKAARYLINGTSYAIGQSLPPLARAILNSHFGPQGQAPPLLLGAPPKIEEVD